MVLNYAQGTYPFPDEFAPPSKKLKPEYGLQAAKAMFYSRNRQGYSIFTQENQQYRALVELAQGRMSTDNIRKMFGFFGSGTTNKDNENLAYLDVQVINLATKYVNRAVAKLQKYKYKIGLNATDPISVDEAKEYNAKIKAYYELKDYYATMGQHAQEFFQDLNLDILPEYPEEILFNLQANQKIRKIMDGEKTIQLVNEVINDMSQRLREFDWFEVVLGRAHLHCYLDENKMPRVETIDPEYWGASYCKNEDFRDAEYQFFVDFITVNQFKKESEGKLTNDEIDSVLRSHAWPNTATTWNTLPDQMINYDGLKYIPVMRFYFLSNDNEAVAMWKNSDGNDAIDARAYSYKPSENKKRQEDIKKISYTSVYGGSWVVDSDIVYDYGKRDIPRSNLVNTRLPIITFAANMKKGRFVSMLSQMIEPLVMLNVAWNKVKEVLAKGRLGILDINLTAFESLALGKGGNQWTAREAVEFLFQSNIAISRRQVNPQSGQSTGENVRFIQTGVTLADYFTTMTECIRFLDDLSGSTLAETNDLPDRLTTKTMLTNVAAGSDAIEYLVNAHTQAYYQASHMLLLLTQEAKRNKVAIQGMIPALGKHTTEFFEVPDELPYCDYGLSMEREATPEEWADFYNQLAGALEKGFINASDSAFIREINNITMARYALATREQINEKKAAKQREQEQQFQMQAQAQAAQQNLQTEQMMQQQKHQDDIELEVIKGKIQEALIEKEKQLDAEIAGVQSAVDERIKRQQGVDSVVKEAIRSRSERYHADKQSQSKVISEATKLSVAKIQAEVTKEAKKEQSKIKPKGKAA